MRISKRLSRRAVMTALSAPCHTIADVPPRPSRTLLASHQSLRQAAHTEEAS